MAVDLAKSLVGVQCREAPIRSAAAGLWRRIRRLLDAHRERQVAAALYRVLSRMSDEELEYRGIARGSLAHHCALRAMGQRTRATKALKDAVALPCMMQASSHFRCSPQDDITDMRR